MTSFIPDYRKLRFVQAENEHDILLIISAFGIFLYASYTIIAGTVASGMFLDASYTIIAGTVATGIFLYSSYTIIAGTVATGIFL